jgi:ElaB/YqjD/DUF883 family membrane-anchored ribosome-binding protein
MQTAMVKTSVFGLMKDLTSEFKTFIRQEVQLAKTEISEKISLMGRNAVSLAVGGFVAYAGLIIFLVALGWLLAFAFESWGLSRPLAVFTGLAVIGLAVALTGYLFIAKALKSFSSESLAPKKTLHTLHELTGKESATEIEPEAEYKPPKPTSEEMQARVEATEQQMGETLDELGRRVSPQYINARIKHRIQEQPYRASLIAIGAGLLSGFLLRWKLRRA